MTPLRVCPPRRAPPPAGPALPEASASQPKSRVQRRDTEPVNSEGSQREPEGLSGPHTDTAEDRGYLQARGGRARWRAGRLLRSRGPAEEQVLTLPHRCADATGVVLWSSSAAGADRAIISISVLEMKGPRSRQVTDSADSMRPQCPQVSPEPRRTLRRLPPGWPAPLGVGRPVDASCPQLGYVLWERWWDTQM